MDWLAVTLLTLALLWCLWRWLPGRKFRGNLIRLHQWPSWRRVYADQKFGRRLDSAIKLPPRERLEALENLVREGIPCGLNQRRPAAEITATGIPEALPRIAGMLDGWEHGSEVLNGVRMAVERGEATEEYRVRVFQMLVPWLDNSTRHLIGREKLPRVLLLLDEEWAKQVLTSPEILHTGHPAFAEVLAALREHGIPVPCQMLEEAAKQLKLEIDDYAKGREYLESLSTLLEQGSSEAARALHELALARRGDSLSNAAAELLIEHLQLPHPRDEILSVADREGESGLSAVERTVWLADMFYEYPVSCAGVDGYFAREESNRWKEAAAALDVIGAGAHAARLRDLAALFGPNGPAHAAEERQIQMDSMKPPYEEQAAAVIARHPSVRDDVFLMELLHLIAHAKPRPGGNGSVPG